MSGSALVDGLCKTAGLLGESRFLVLIQELEQIRALELVQRLLEVVVDQKSVTRVASLLYDLHGVGAENSLEQLFDRFSAVRTPADQAFLMKTLRATTDKDFLKKLRDRR
jgi:hypothetical protein